MQPLLTADALRVRPVDRLMGVYALVSGLALILPHRPDIWPLLALLHLGVAWLALHGPGAGAVRAFIGRTLPFAGILRDWYPILVLPALYTELATLNVAAHGGRVFDEIVIAWEQILFSGQPSLEWARSAPRLLLSETLHAAYLSYYLLLFMPALLIFLKRSREEFRRAVFTIMLAFLAHYVFFIYFPVEGPRYRFDPPTGGIESGFFYQLAHRALEAGSSRGAAFPSSHVGGAVAITIATMRTLPGFAIPTGALTLGLALGAIYGGFHYATDALAGLALALIAALIAPAIYRRLLRDTATPRPVARTHS